MTRRMHVGLAVLALAGVVAASSGLSAGVPQGSPGVISLKGGDTLVKQAAKIAAGVYLVTSSPDTTFVSLTLTQNGAPAWVNIFSQSESDLIVVDGNTIKAGDATFEGDGVDTWALTIAKVDGSGAGAVPVVLTAAEMKNAISKPFKAAAGDLNVTYAYKAEPRGTGTLLIGDVATGKLLRTGMMTAGKSAGTLTVAVPAAGTFIAMTRFPLGSGGGEVKIAQ
jgi:hypothetical protein